METNSSGQRIWAVVVVSIRFIFPVTLCRSISRNEHPFQSFRVAKCRKMGGRKRRHDINFASLPILRPVMSKCAFLFECSKHYENFMGANCCTMASLSTQHTTFITLLLSKSRDRVMQRIFWLAFCFNSCMSIWSSLRISRHEQMQNYEKYFFLRSVFTSAYVTFQYCC